MITNLSLVVVLRALLWGKTVCLTPTPIEIQADKPAIVNLQNEIQALSSGAHFYLAPLTGKHLTIEEYINFKSRNTTPWGRIEADDIRILAVGNSSEEFKYVGIAYSKQPVLVFRRLGGAQTGRTWTQVEVHSGVALGLTELHWKNYEL